MTRYKNLSYGSFRPHLTTLKTESGWEVRTTAEVAKDKVWTGASESEAISNAKNELNQLLLKGEIQ